MSRMERNIGFNLDQLTGCVLNIGWRTQEARDLFALMREEYNNTKQLWPLRRYRALQKIVEMFTAEPVIDKLLLLSINKFKPDQDSAGFSRKQPTERNKMTSKTTCMCSVSNDALKHDMAGSDSDYSGSDGCESLWKRRSNSNGHSGNQFKKLCVFTGKRQLSSVSDDSVVSSSCSGDSGLSADRSRDCSRERSNRHTTSLNLDSFNVYRSRDCSRERPERHAASLNLDSISTGKGSASSGRKCRLFLADVSRSPTLLGALASAGGCTTPGQQPPPNQQQQTSSQSRLYVSDCSASRLTFSAPSSAHSFDSDRWTAFPGLRLNRTISDPNQGKTSNGRQCKVIKSTGNLHGSASRSDDSSLHGRSPRGDNRRLTHTKSEISFVIPARGRLPGVSSASNLTKLSRSAEHRPSCSNSFRSARDVPRSSKELLGSEETRKAYEGTKQLLHSPVTSSASKVSNKRTALSPDLIDDLVLIIAHDNLLNLKREYERIAAMRVWCRYKKLKAILKSCMNILK